MTNRVANLSSDPWTDEEKQDALILSYAEFCEKWGDRRSPNAYWSTRKRLKQRGDTVPPAPDDALSHAKRDPSLDDLEALFESIERAEAIRPHISPTEQVYHTKAPDHAPFGVAFMSDIHAGASGVDYARFRHDLEVIRDTEGLGVIINGDLMENAKVMSKAGNALYHAAFTSPREQYLYIKTRLSTIQDKIIAILAGNHDSRDGSHAGIDRLPDLCRDLDTHYGTEAGMTVYLTVGDERYTIVAKHDYQGKSSITKTNSARRLWTEWPHAWDSADVIALAHLHEPMLSVQYQRGKDVVWLRSGAYKIHDEYALSKGYKSQYGVPVVVFFPDERKLIPFADFDEGVRYLNSIRG